MSYLLLGASLVALVAAPAVISWARRAQWTLAALDGFVLVSIGGLTIAHVLPEAVEMAGWASLLAALVGLGGPIVLERWMRAAARQVHVAALFLALTGILAHAFVDGMVIAGPGHLGEGTVGALALAVVVHRLPVALTVWTLLAAPYGWARASLALGLIALGTVMGFFGGSEVVGPEAHSVWLGWFEALVAGSLLHVVLHRATHEAAATVRGWRIAAGLGALTGLALVLALSPVGHAGEHAAHEAGVTEVLLALALESAPALLLAYLVSGVVHAWLPKAGVAWLGRGNALSQSTRGVAFGLPLPMCSCGVIPVYRSLILQGVPATAAMAFFVATPELGLDAIFLSIPLLGPEITAARVVAAAVVALLVGVVVGRMARKRTLGVLGSAAVPDRPADLRGRLRESVRVGFGEMVDATSSWIVLGLVVAAVLDPMLTDSQSPLHHVPDLAEVAVFALLGMPAYVCASGATPLVAVLIAHGVSPGAAVAFLLTGPATNVTTFGVLSALHGRRVAIVFGALVGGAAIGIGHLVNAVLPNLTTAPIEHLHLDDAGHLRVASLAVLLLLVVLSVLRQGPREFIAHIVPGDNDECNGACGAPCHDDGDRGGGHGCHDHDHAPGPKGEGCGSGSGGCCG